MKRLVCGWILCLAVLWGGGWPPEADAALGLSLASSDNLNALPAGTPVTFHVQLAGLEPGQELDSLAATVAYNLALLGPPTIAGGAILPAAMDDPGDFMTSPAAGQADASFLTFGTLPSHHIAANGTFFSFTTSVLSPGSGSLSFTWTDATLFNAADPVHPIASKPTAGPPLAFTAVPEPAGLALLAPLLAVVAVFVRRSFTPSSVGRSRTPSTAGRSTAPSSSGTECNSVLRDRLFELPSDSVPSVSPW